MTRSIFAALHHVTLAAGVKPPNRTPPVAALDGYGEVAFHVERGELLAVFGKFVLHLFGEEADFALQDPLARRMREVVLEVVEEPLTVPESQRPHAAALALDDLGHEGVPHQERFREIPDQRMEKLFAHY